jgi:hypothetical protein
MKITAAILWEQGAPLSIEPAEIDAPGPGEPPYFAEKASSTLPGIPLHSP